MMMTYLTITLLLSSICGLAILLLRGAPARLRFYICLLVLVSWLTPWQFLQFQSVSSSFTLPLNILSEFNLLNPVAATKDSQLIASIKEQPAAPLEIFYWLWLATFTIGLALFFKDVVNYVKLHRRWMKYSTLDNQVWKTANIVHSNCDIRRINTEAPGMATGLTRPIIWLESGQHEVDKIRTIVLHELTHIRQYDPYWLWAINLVQRLFWWNPLICFTVNYARQQMELSCDEQCQKHLPKGDYQLQLIKLTLQVNRHHHSLPMPAVLQMSGTPAFNLQRINKLNEEHKMKKRYVVVMTSLLSLTGWIGFSNATINTEGNTEKLASHEVQTASLVDVLNTINNQDFTGAQTQLDSLAKNVGSFDTSEQAKIWKLYAHVLYELDAKNPQIIDHIDKAVALEYSLTKSELLSILHMAQALAASQERWDKQLSYANKWFNIADDNEDKKALLFMTAVSHFSLEQYDTSATLLNELVSISETQGFQPKENWLKLLMANYVENNNSADVMAVQEKIAMLYPSKKNKKLLNDLSQKR
jgi:beta-lactamase regulating signal transducer with metallopeptidase domain